MVKARIIDTEEVAPGRFVALEPGGIPEAIANIRRVLKGARLAADLWNDIRGELDDTIAALTDRPPRLNPRRTRTGKVPEARRL